MSKPADTGDHNRRDEREPFRPGLQRGPDEETGHHCEGCDSGQPTVVRDLVNPQAQQKQSRTVADARRDGHRDHLEDIAEFKQAKKPDQGAGCHEHEAAGGQAGAQLFGRQVQCRGMASRTARGAAQDYHQSDVGRQGGHARARYHRRRASEKQMHGRHQNGGDHRGPKTRRHRLGPQQADEKQNRGHGCGDASQRGLNAAPQIGAMDGYWIHRRLAPFQIIRFKV